MSKIRVLPNLVPKKCVVKREGDEAQPLSLACSVAGQDGVRAAGFQPNPALLQCQF